MNKSTQGFTFIELLIVIFISGLVLGAISIFAGRIFNVSREHQEQVLITEDARSNVRRVEHAIRNAANIIIQDEEEGPEERFWLEKAGHYDITFYSNIDSDSDVERVRYYIEGTELKMDVWQPNPDGKYPPGQRRTSIISRNVRNLENGLPLFNYYSAGTGQGALLDPNNMTITSVKRVVISLQVDVNPNQHPAASTVTTQVTPRRVVDPRGVEAERLNPIDLILPEDTSVSTEATLNWPLTNESESVQITELNSRLSTYHQRRENWTTRFEGQWRVKVLDDAIPLTWLQDPSNGCLAPEYDDVSEFVLDNCVERTATDANGNTVFYHPIFLYTNPNNAITDYIRNITVE